jgi:hypothetical protein
MKQQRESACQEPVEPVAPAGKRRSPSVRRRHPGKGTGRPRPDDDDLTALLGAALEAPATIVEDGISRRGTKREQIAAQLVESSANADIRATKLLLDLLEKLRPAASRQTEPAPLGDDDEKVISLFLARLGAAE